MKRITITVNLDAEVPDDTRDIDLLAADMDITACHLNGCPLDLGKLMNARDGDFGHDVFGIRRHINRTTGQLEEGFAPRCALPESTH